MARPVWSGALTFGLVSLPVQMHAATREHRIAFHQIERGTTDRVRNKRVNERTGREVASDDIVKGFEIPERDRHAPHQHVVVEPEELADIAPGRSRTLEITRFVPLDAIRPVSFDATYYLSPRGDAYGKVYTLLRKALRGTGRAGVATLVMHDREHLVAVEAEDDVLCLHTLHWADEIRDPRDQLPDLPGEPRISSRELDSARRLIDAMTTRWAPEEFHDTYREDVARLVAAKRKGQTPEQAARPPESTNVVNLMDALEESLARSGSGSGGRSRGPGSGRGRGSGGRAARQPGGGRRRAGSGAGGTSRTSRSPRPARSPSKGASPQGASPKGESSQGASSQGASSQGASPSRKELYRRAAEAGISGRSRMTRAQLLDALSARGTSRARPARASRAGARSKAS